MRRPSRGLAWAALLGVVLACRSSEPTRIDTLALDAVEGLDVLGLTRDQVLSTVQRRAEKARFRVARDDGGKSAGHPWRLVASVRALEPDNEKPREVTVRVILSLHQKGGTESWEARKQHVELAQTSQLEDVQSTSRAALEASLGEALREAAALIEASTTDGKDLRERLGDGDAIRRDAAGQVLARRGDRAALPTLLQRLKSPEEDELLRTLGLLVDLKAPESVPAIIDAAGRRSPPVQLSVVFALAEIGGAEAEAYLFTLAQGHTDEALRAAAQAALDQLHRGPRRGPSEGAQP